MRSLFGGRHYSATAATTQVVQITHQHALSSPAATVSTSGSEKLDSLSVCNTYAVELDFSPPSLPNNCVLYPTYGYYLPDSDDWELEIRGWTFKKPPAGPAATIFGPLVVGLMPSSSSSFSHPNVFSPEDQPMPPLDGALVTPNTRERILGRMDRVVVARFLASPVPNASVFINIAFTPRLPSNPSSLSPATPYEPWLFGEETMYHPHPTASRPDTQHDLSVPSFIASSSAPSFLRRILGTPRSPSLSESSVTAKESFRSLSASSFSSLRKLKGLKVPAAYAPMPPMEVPWTPANSASLESSSGSADVPSSDNEPDSLLLAPVGLAVPAVMSGESAVTMAGTALGESETMEAGLNVKNAHETADTPLASALTASKENGRLADLNLQGGKVRSEGQTNERPTRPPSLAATTISGISSSSVHQTIIPIRASLTCVEVQSTSSGWLEGKTRLSGLDIARICGPEQTVIGGRWESGRPVVLESGTVRPGRGLIVTAPLYLIPPSGLSLISDLDDTVKISHIALGTRALLATALSQPWFAVPGMAEVYRRIHAKGASIHYVSSSPHQLHSHLTEFLATNGFPPGTMHLRRFGLSESTRWDMGGGGPKIKEAKVKEMMGQFPGRKFILVGDSGEDDAGIYASTYRNFPSQVGCILIRDVSATSNHGDSPSRSPHVFDPERLRERMEKAFDGVPRGIWKLFRDPSDVWECPAMKEIIE
ncbi:hypothetical protein HDU93_005073 [Gonapodya sp. JEL0774]|nr:hypothetical protein HDU93_005073 [Gonapodya sp. JEL0774]